jgi:hemerythrin-like metal-binding protein
MEWTESLVLGLVPMDLTHQEFVEVYNDLAGANQAGFLARLDAFIAHCQTHFDQENGWMAAVNFPGCHKGEHDRVLAVLHDVRKRVAAGDWFLGKRLVEELPAWFENHAGGMDAALAFHLESIGFDTATGRIEAVPDSAGGDSGKSGCACAVLSDEGAAHPRVC